MRTEWPPVTIVTTTYYPKEGNERFKLAERAIASWVGHLKYDGELKLHIADDGSGEEYRSRMEKWDYGLVTTYSVQDRRNVGASLNAGFKIAFRSSKLGIYLVDDWILPSDYDLNPWVDLLLEDESIGIVRIGTPHPNLTGKITKYPHCWAVLLDKHDFPYGMRPAIYHKRFFDSYGWFEIGMSAWECERHYNLNFCHNQNTKPAIVLALPDQWEHIGILELGKMEFEVNSLIKEAYRLAMVKGHACYGDIDLIGKLVGVLGERPIVVQLGAGSGTMSLAVLGANPDAFLYSVDHSQHELDAEMINLRNGGYTGERIPILSKSDNAATIYNGGEIDLLIVDADHSYEYAIADLKAWEPMVKSGGWIFMHDFDGATAPIRYPGVKQATDEYFNREYDLKDGWSAAWQKN